MTANPREIDLTPNALTVLTHRYLMKDDQGRVVESPEELVRRVAANIAQADLRYDGHAATRERADLHLSLGVERNAERFKIMNGLHMDLLRSRRSRQFRDLFWGLLLRTRRNR